MFDYQGALDYLSGLLRFGIKLGLDRFTELCHRLGDPQNELRVIHVGGTNGKGSTCAFITSILRQAGYSVGTYLSPYVYDVRERIQLNGEMIPEEDFAELMSEIAPQMEAIAGTELGQGTEFEAKTAMAFLYFARKKVDFAVIEVGMGGRYDCTNLVSPLVSVITNVSLDHTERLGDTVAKIAWDKAGIAKASAPLVTAASDEAWQAIFRTAAEQGVEEMWRVVPTGHVPGPDVPAPTATVVYEGSDGEVTVELPAGIIGPVNLRLAGDFQLTNAATAAAAVAALTRAGHDGVYVRHSAIEKGLKAAYLPGRMEVLRRRPTVVIDAAHNPDGAKSLADSLKRHFEYQRLILVVGMLSTHSADEVLATLAPMADEIIATRSSWEKATPADEIAQAALRYNASVRVIEPVPAAVREALDMAGEKDLVLVTGSFYTIGEVDRDVVSCY
jgi:dihydrofolate synthase/folylpolyglutamate synthase